MFKSLLGYKYSLIMAISIISCGSMLPTAAQSINQEATYQEPSFFLRSPRLVRSATTFRGPRAIASYLFAIEIPQNAGNNLQAVVISQQKNLEEVRFLPDRTRAFIGDTNGEEIAIDTVVEQDSNQNGVRVVFKEPVKPGQKVTLAIGGRNPLYGGIYQFGITVYPQGDNPKSLYLGTGRIHFSTPGGRS